MTKITSGEAFYGGDAYFGEPRLPDGRKVADVKPSDMFRILSEAGVPGIAADMGKSGLWEAYNQHCMSIYDEAGSAALAAWKEQHRPKLGGPQ